MRAFFLILLGSMALFAFGMAAPAGAQCLGFSGTWETEFGKMAISVTGTRGFARYVDPQGDTNTLAGTVTDGVFQGRFSEPNRGNGVFKFALTGAGETFFGTYEYDNRTASGTWHGRCIAAATPTQPLPVVRAKPPVSAKPPTAAPAMYCRSILGRWPPWYSTFKDGPGSLWIYQQSAQVLGDGYDALRGSGDKYSFSGQWQGSFGNFDYTPIHAHGTFSLRTTYDTKRHLEKLEGTYSFGAFDNPAMMKEPALSKALAGRPTTMTGPFSERSCG